MNILIVNIKWHNCGRVDRRIPQCALKMMSLVWFLVSMLWCTMLTEALRTGCSSRFPGSFKPKKTLQSTSASALGSLPFMKSGLRLSSRSSRRISPSPSQLFSSTSSSSMGSSTGKIDELLQLYQMYLNAIYTVVHFTCTHHSHHPF